MSFEFAEIIDSVITRTDAINLLRELDVLVQALYKLDSQSFVNTLDNCVSEKLSRIIKRELKESVTGEDLERRRSLLREIKSSVTNLDEVKLEIAIEPTGSMLRRIHKWIKDNWGEGKIVDVKVNENILAGAIITHQGKYYDFSLTKKWKEIWENIRKEMVVSGVKN